MTESQQSSINDALSAQADAANPDHSAFVSANAGSGKTHVLINRVTRLLMRGCPPENILCVTFTKAAAAEMLTRLYDRLGGYSIMNDADLRNALQTLDSRAPAGNAGLARARALFAQALETPGGLKIRTIHSFCESLLRRFPAEAGISPGFSVMDDSTGAELRQEIRKQLGNMVRLAPQEPLAHALAHMAGLGANTLDDIHTYAFHNALALQQAMGANGDLDTLLQASAKALNVDPRCHMAQEKEKLWQTLEHDRLGQLASIMATGSPKDKTCAEGIKNALKCAKTEGHLNSLYGAFFTKANTLRQKLPTKGLRTAHPDMAAYWDTLGLQLQTMQEHMHAVQTMQDTRAAARLAVAIARLYKEHKTARGALDYDDLINKSVALLSDAEAAQWVLYKLDYHLSHILVDEAQDNSGPQWALIHSLSAEFFAGAGVGDSVRTLFAVGDCKQSIYSFQGANPALFEGEATRLADLARQIETRFAQPELALSWRSSAQVLGAVDATFLPLTRLETKFQGDPVAFAAANAPQSAPGFGHYVTHQAQRAGQAGCVELWDPIARPVDEQTYDPARPVNADTPQSARNVLAQKTAAQIAHWINTGEQIWHRGDNNQWQQRAIRPGDIMILVRKRGGLFEEIIRQLKKTDVPVAGADRMVLCQQTAVLDLLSAARAALQQADDLALAELLKGPFLQPAEATCAPIDDDVLFDLAAKRGLISLSEALHNSTNPLLSEARTLYSFLRNLARSEGPYGFFSPFLSAPSASGESYARRLYARLGPEAEDPVREFLGKALSHQKDYAPSLLRFVTACQNDQSDIKRQMENAGDAVRVMTVHASKGLEAPLVILPDTTQNPLSKKLAGFLTGGDNALFWSAAAKEDPAPCRQIRDALAAKEAQEQQRLLYVAMTRAQDRLVICGAKMGNGEGSIHEQSWYAHIDRAFAGFEDRGALEHFETGTGLGARRYGPAPHTGQRGADLQSGYADLPAWAVSPLAEALPRAHTAAPSRWLDKSDEDDDQPGFSPLGTHNARRFRRGTVIHTLLQTLPESAPAQRKKAARRFLHAQKDLNEAQRDDIIQAVFSVLDNPDFAFLFGPDSRAELPLAGQASSLPPGLVINGQIDRIVVREKDVFIVDYKTNRPAPKRPEDVSRRYLAQMAAYRALAHDLWPGRKITGALLWTETPHLMILADKVLDAALQKAHTS